jgi:cellulose synthase/poly-beta-1,6-N-acetylglucosamine synthase-like glycosyltransferase
LVFEYFFTGFAWATINKNQKIMMIPANSLVLFYSIMVAYFLWVWLKNYYFNKPKEEFFDGKMGISVIVPVRNEAKSIFRLLQSIENQTLNKNRFEVILVDDSSDDQTIEIIKNYNISSDLDIKILNLSSTERGNSPKKNAITKAIGFSKYPIIMTTDGDCEIPQNLLATYVDYFNNPRVMFLSGPVTFLDKKKGYFDNIWNSIQTVEFVSLIGVGAVSILLGVPNMCSGANLAYRKSVFLEINGYEGNEDIASGDDEFLMHKIAQKFKNGVFYSQNRDTVVVTESVKNIFEFYNQRKRWSGKWTKYNSLTPQILAVFIFLVNLFTIYAIFKLNLSILAIRWISEFLFISVLLQFLNKKRKILYIPLVQILYPFYAVFFGLISIWPDSSYSWKQRKLK